MASLQEDLADRWLSKMKRGSVVSPSRWATEYRIMPTGDHIGPWSFEYFPWLKEMHDSESEYNVGQKCAQMGYSETMLNLAFYNLDIKKCNVLYLLPNLRPDAQAFTARAFNPAIDTSPHIKQMFGTKTNNIQHKVCGSANLYIRGTNVKSALKSVPVNVLIFDEFDEMDKQNVELAEKRTSGQKYRKNWKVSTPTGPNCGINTYFLRSTQEHFFFPCPCCSRMIELQFPDNLVIVGEDPDDPRIMESHLICRECKGVLPHQDKHKWLRKAEWVPRTPGKMMRGFYINQLYSTSLEPYNTAKDFLLCKRDPQKEQEFYNSNMGLPHIVAGAEITDDMIGNLIKGYEMVSACRPDSIVTMGIDVNRTYNVEICQWDLADANPIDINAKARCKVIWVGEIEDLMGQGSDLMLKYNVNFCVIDAMPETHLAEQFANAWYGRVRMCRYNHFATARSVFAADKDISCSVNRTSWLDQSLGRFRNGTILLPRNLPREYAEQIKSPIRTPCKDTNGNLVYRYLERDNLPDHYAHARNYAEIALLFATGANVHQTIKKKV